MFKEIIVTIDRFEGQFAILKHKDHELLWPKEDLPSGSEEGGVITLTAMNEKQATKNRAEMAKTILNDILNDTLKAPGTVPPTVEEHETIEEDTLEKINKNLEQINRNTRSNE